MLVKCSLRSIALKGGLLALTTLVFLGGLGTRLSSYQPNQERTTISKVRLGVDKPTDLRAVLRSQLRATQADLSFLVSSSYLVQQTPHVTYQPEKSESVAPARPSYGKQLPQLAYRPPPAIS